MSIPLLKICDIPERDHNKNLFFIHDLKKLVNEDMYIPKVPHRHSFYQVLYIKSGTGVHYLDFREVNIHDHIIFFLSPGQVHDLRFSGKRPEGYMINFRDELFNDFLSQKNFIDTLPVFNRNGNSCFRTVSECKREVDTVFTKILRIFNADFHYKFPTIQTLLLEMLLMIAEKTQNEDRLADCIRSNIVTKKFEQLLEKHFQEAHYPKFYADHLAITPNYLNSVCKSVTGKTAGKLIRNRIVLESKRLLMNSGLTISQIAYELYFEDNSYFTKFFKTQTGITPNQFRKHQNK